MVAAITFLALWLCINSFVQAAAAAQAGASVIQIFVGRLRVIASSNEAYARMSFFYYDYDTRTSRSLLLGLGTQPYW